LKLPDEIELELAENASTRSETPTVRTISPDGIALIEDPTITSGREALLSLNRKRARRQKSNMLVGSSILLLVVVLTTWLMVSGGTSKPKKVAKQSQHDVAKKVKKTAAPQKPVKNIPLTLHYLPTGANIVIHFKPEKLWTKKSVAEHVRLSLGPLGEWIKKKIGSERFFLFSPEEIEDVVLGIYVFHNEPIRTAAFVRLVKKYDLPKFKGLFHGEATEKFGRKIYLASQTEYVPERAYLLIDTKSFAFSSIIDAEDLVESFATPGLPSGGIQELLDLTSRNHDLSLIFEPRDLKLFQKQLVPANTIALLNRFLDRFSDEHIETLSWSFDFGDRESQPFRSELLLRNRTTILPGALRNKIQTKLKEIPEEMYVSFRKMHPEFAGHRKLIGRLPVMLQAFSTETVSQRPKANVRFIKFVTELPAIAAPNLAVAGMLAWNESLRTDFDVPIVKNKTKKLPATVAGRLRMKLDIDFRRTPLQEAFDYIAQELKIKLEIDGPALKDLGYTKNMPQQYKLGRVTGTEAISKIVKQYKGMGIVVDEAKKLVTVTTEKFAKQKGWKIFELNK